jgi:predicted RNA-binding protein YlqC (UPF0109 family)
MTAKDFLQSILESLVENKAAINIQEKYDELGTLLSIEVDTSDMGAIIGKSWKTIDALRTVIRVFGSKRGRENKYKTYWRQANPIVGFSSFLSKNYFTFVFFFIWSYK